MFKHINIYNNLYKSSIITPFYTMSKITSISEMICLAYHDDYHKKSKSDKENIRRWAESIMTYLNIKEST